MKLLILGLIIMFVLVIQLYIMKREQEGYVSVAEKVLVSGERNFLNKQDKYWDIRKQGIGAGLLVAKPGINDWYKLDDSHELKKFTPKIGLDRSAVDKGVTNCRALTTCAGLGNNNCGYCAFDKEFRYGDKNGPSANVCPKKAWTTDAKKCVELREKEICANVKSCGDLYGEAEKICGYCPTTGVAMAMKKYGNKFVPKYSDDVCSAQGYGLLPGDKCGKFLKDHPCITPYYLSGPHSGACVEKLWKNSGCTTKNPYGKTYKQLGASIKMPYKRAGTLMKNTNNQTRSTNYKTAVTSSDMCFGNHNNIKPCDQKYNRQGIPVPACLRKEYLEAGCVPKGKGWLELVKDTWYTAKRHVSQANKYAINRVVGTAPARWFGWSEGRYGHPGRGRTSQGQGDCDRDSDCKPGFKCGHDKTSLPGVRDTGGRGWKYCATEGGRCYANGQVRYGLWGRYSYRNSRGSIGCNNRTFGDPYWGRRKYCWVKRNVMGGGRDFCYPADDTITAANYKKLMRRISNLTVDSNDYSTRLATSKLCYGVIPPRPPPLKAGDEVTYNKTVEEGALLFRGIVTKKDGNICRVMWISTRNSAGVERKRETMSQEDQKKYLGWPGLSPTFNKSLPSEIQKRRLNIKHSCSNDKSVCKKNCYQTVRAVEWQFPRPRDCIVGKWSAWGACSKKCAGGIQTQTRPLLYPAKFGGNPCPVLKGQRVCNTRPCMNPNFYAKN